MLCVSVFVSAEEVFGDGACVEEFLEWGGDEGCGE